MSSKLPQPVNPPVGNDPEAPARRRRHVSQPVAAGVPDGVAATGSEMLSPDDIEKARAEEGHIRKGGTFANPEQEFPLWPQIYQQVRDAFIERTTGTNAVSSDALREPAAFYDFVNQVIQSNPQFSSHIRPVDMERLVVLLRAYQFGYGALEDYMRISGLEEIYFNRYDQGFYIVSGDKRKIDQTIFADAGELQEFVRRIAIANDLEFNLQRANIDATLKDGSRLNATLPPLSVDGVDMVIRKHREIPFTIQQLIEGGTLTQQLATDLENWIHGGANFIVSGGTSSGKTSFLNTLGNTYIPRDDRVLILENRKELQIYTEDTKYFQTREDAMREGGENDVTMRDLIRFCLRKRPDRILVGEVRGSEAFHALTAWNSGHDGSFCTMHANSAMGALSKLEQLCGYAGELGEESVRMLIADAVDIIIQVKRNKGHDRREVVEVVQVLHPYKADSMDGSVQRQVQDLRREGFIREMETGIWTLRLYSRDAEGNLVKHFNLIPIEGKSAR